MIEQQRDGLCYLQFNHFLQFPEIVHGVFTRLGGCSDEPYTGLNTSSPPRGGGDSVDNVIHNRAIALQALGMPSLSCVTLWQVHGADVVTLKVEDEWRTDWAYHSYYERSWTPQSIRKGDALITRERGISLALSFADCVPLAFYDPVAQAIGIAHGGWRGTARGIVFSTLDAMNKQFGSKAADIYAGIGPAIGSCCYEVSETVQRLFLGQESFDDMPTSEEYQKLVRESAVFTTHHLPTKTSLRLNLQATNYNQFLMAGLPPANIEVMDICTSCNTDRFFSHRGEQGKTGRFPIIMALNPPV